PPAATRPFPLVSIIEPSPHDAGTAYVATTRYKHDDFKPYLWKTTNYGRTWTRITNGIRPDDFTRVIREDPTRRGLLYAGSETGVYVSFDDGAKWHRLGGNLPVVPIHDLTVKDSDLVLGTHGRSFWVLDDLSPIRQLAASGGVRGAVHLFEPRPTVRFRTDFGFPQPPKIGKNYRMTGATIVTYRQVEKATGEQARAGRDACRRRSDLGVRRGDPCRTDRGAWPVPREARDRRRAPRGLVRDPKRPPRRGHASRLRRSVRAAHEDPRQAQRGP